MENKLNFDLEPLHKGFYEEHQNNLKLLAVLANDDDRLRWGVFLFLEQFSYEKSNKNYRASAWGKNKEGYEFEDLDNGPKCGNYPLLIIPLNERANSLAMKTIDEDGSPQIEFNTVYFVNPGGGNGYITKYIQRLNSKLIVNKDKEYKANNFFCKIKSDKEHYFWIFKLDPTLQNKFHLNVYPNHLKKSNVESQMTIEKESDTGTPIFKFLNDQIYWDQNFKCKVKRNNTELQSINFNFKDIHSSGISSDGLVIKSDEIKICYYENSQSITSIQLNNDIYVKYTEKGKVNLLTEAFSLVSALKKSVVETRKSQPFAVLPILTAPSKYNLYAHYKVEQDVATLISTEIESIEGSLNLTSLPFEIQNPIPELIISDYPEVNDNGTFLRLMIGKYTLPKDQIIFDGSLEFGLGEEAKFNENDLYDHNGKISFVLQRISSQKPLFLWEWDGQWKDVEIGYSIEDFSIPVKTVKPISQDLTTNEKYLAPSSTEAIVNGYGERQQKQLIIPLSEKQENDYYLCISESLNLGQDFRVDMRLVEVSPKVGNDQSKRIKTIVLDSSPQFVGLVDSNFLLQRGYDDGVWVLAQKIQNNLNEGVWEIFDDQSNKEGFNLILPAQTIGEEFIKDKPEGEEESLPLPYRFGASAILKIAGDKLEKNYVAPPWDLRKLWGTAGDLLPGSPLLRAEFELLYGLQADFKPQNTLVAELGARLGDLPVPINNNLAWKGTTEQVESFYQNWINYLKYYRAWKSRLAILETYRANEPEVEATFVAPNMVNEELDYKPRLNIEINQSRGKIVNKINKQQEEINKIFKKLEKEEDHNIREILINDLNKELTLMNNLNQELSEIENPNLEGILTGAQLFIPDKTFKDEIIKIDDNDISLATFHEGKHGSDESFLKGGFTYGFQDKEIYKSFLQKALTEGSTSAELSGLAFSSQGGYGKQVARFDNDLTAIKSLTAMGRVHRSAVERIGRIGIFWHKAKHVIEYERTVVRSEYEKENQNPLLGRPLVRKVREYIEILEPEKKYPDFEGHSPKDTGAVNACVFKSTIIPISNSWGRIVYKSDTTTPMGWEVPLWYEGADEALYPKPQIFFLLEPPKDSNLQHSTVQLAEPQNLMFYTAYIDGADGAEPDKEVSAWKSVYGVDYTDKPILDESVLQPHDIASNDKDRLDRTMPNAMDVLPGHGRFTFKVEPQLTPAGMANVYQPNSGLSGVLRTVSMQRNGEVTKSNNKADLNIGTIAMSSLFQSYSDVTQVKAQFDAIKENLTLLTSYPGLKYLISPVEKDVVQKLSIPAQILWFKILQYSDNFLQMWNDLKTRVNAEKEKGRLIVETEFQKIVVYELQFTELLLGLKWLCTLSDEQLKRLKEFKKSFYEILQPDDDSKVNDAWFIDIKNRILEEFNKLNTELEFFDDSNVDDIINRIQKTVEEKINNYQLKINKTKKEVLTEIRNFIDEADFSEISTIQHKLDEGLKKSLNEIQKINGQIENVKASVFENINDAGNLITNFNLIDLIKEVLASLYIRIARFDTILNTIEPFKSIGKIEDEIDELIHKTSPEIHEIQSKINEYISLATSKYDLAVTAVSSGQELNTATQNVLTNYRSVWEEITAPGMGLNRKTIALIVNKVENAKQIEQQLSITPCIAKYKQFESDLNALGVRLPVTHIFNELKAPTEEWLQDKGKAIESYIKNIKFPESLTNLGAMDFDGMFKGFTLPADFTKNVKFSQGFDKENLSAWAKANLDYKISDAQEMFSISMASVWLSNTHLTAEIEGNVNADGVTGKKEKGELLGDFAIKIGNNPLITFEQAKIIYKNGKMDFDLDPSRMKMDGVLKMITDATQNLNQFNNEAKAQENEEAGEEDNDKPFKIKILKATVEQLLGKEKNTKTYKTPKNNLEKTEAELEKLKQAAENVEIPYGIKATLDIPAISVGGGTTSMTNLGFGAQFVLRFFNPEQKKLEFVTGLGFYIGKREAPFNFTAFIFGGGGFVDTLIYYSADKGTEIDFAMSIHASAGLFFNAGWVSGSVFIYLGLEGQYAYRNEVGSTMTFTLFAQLVGTLNIMGLVSAYMLVRLALSYDGYRMIGRGYISIEIEICWCVTVSVSSSFEKQFTGSKQETKKSTQQSSISASLG